MPEWAAVHWVHMHNMDDMMMRRLGVKFRLHPLALEDAMVPVVDAMSLEQRPKAEKFKEHLFFIIPRVRSVQAREFQSYLTFSCFNYVTQIRRNITQKITGKSTLECKLNYDENVTRLVEHRYNTFRTNLSRSSFPGIFTTLGRVDMYV